MAKLPPKTIASGQALLIVLLSMAVVLTIVLSVLSRSVTDITVTTREEEALRAFSAAEAGVERALIIGADVSGSVGDASFTAEVSGLASAGSEYAHPANLLSGESVIFWFVEHDEETGELECDDDDCFTGRQVRFCWGDEGAPAGQDTTPAIEISIIYSDPPIDDDDSDYSNVKTARATADSYPTRTPPNNFGSTDPGTCQVENEVFEFQKVVDVDTLGVPSSSYNFQNGLQFVSVRMLYNTGVAHKVGIDVNFPGNTLLPSQGLRIESTGSFGEANRRVEVFQTFGELPPIFGAAVFSPTGLVK